MPTGHQDHKENPRLFPDKLFMDLGEGAAWDTTAVRSTMPYISTVDPTSLGTTSLGTTVVSNSVGIINDPIVQGS